MAETGQKKDYYALPWLEGRVYRRGPARATRINRIFWILIGICFVVVLMAAFFVLF